jgi:hypothetical protein
MWFSALCVVILMRLRLLNRLLTRKPVAAGPVLPSLDNPNADPWVALRAPPNEEDRTLVSSTHFWLHSVPSGAHPKRLCHQYPRIANKLAVNWHNKKAAEQILDDLLHDKRGNRQGFAPEITAELLRLREVLFAQERRAKFVIRRRK